MNQQNVVSADCGDSTTSSIEHSPTIIAQTSANKQPRPRFSLEQKQALESTLLQNAKQQLPQLNELLNQVEDEWGIEDGVYRFYHGSYKVYQLQGLTLEICKVLEALLPDRPLNEVFRGIVTDGTGRTIEDSQDKDWPKDTRPIVEALFHAHYFLKMTCKYAEELDAQSEALPSGWAAVLYFFDLR